MAADVNQGGTSEEVLAALFPLPSDSESDDDLEESDAEHADGNRDAASCGDILSDVVDDDDDDDDDDILYTLASDASEVESDVEEHDTSDVDSDEEESDWRKTVIKSINVDFDAIQVVPKNAFLPSDGPLEFFSKFFVIELIELLVQQTNLYAKLCSFRGQPYDVPVSSSAFSCSPVQLLISNKAGKREWAAFHQKAQYTQGCNAE